MDIIRKIIEDYENIINTKITIPLDNGDIINFAFHRQDLPHLLGLQHLVDNPVLFEYGQKRLSATKLYEKMCGIREGAVDTNEFEKSIYFEELYESRIKYFSSRMLLDIIQAKQIVEFLPEKIKNFSTKLENVGYMFWKHYNGGGKDYGYFGIGVMATGNKTDINYPNTFFFRSDDEYICNQKIVFPMSFMKVDRNRKMDFDIFWEKIQYGLKKTAHYKWLGKKYLMGNGELDFEAIRKSDNEDTARHFLLLKLDALDKVYLPYMKRGFWWGNDEKKYILEKLEKKSILYPNEVKMLLNQYKQRDAGI